MQFYVATKFKLCVFYTYKHCSSRITNNSITVLEYIHIFIYNFFCEKFAYTSYKNLLNIFTAT